VYDDVANKLSGDGLWRWVEKNILGMANPILKFPLEKITERSFFTGEARDRFKLAPETWIKFQQSTGLDIGVKKITTKSGKEYHTLDNSMVDLYEALWSDAPTSRILRSVDRLMREDEPVVLRLMNFLTGVKTYSVNKEIARRRALERVLKKLSKQNPDLVRMFARVYATSEGKADPRIKTMIAEYSRLAREDRTAPDETPQWSSSLFKMQTGEPFPSLLPRNK
jgi:hypothetical protein